MGKRGPRPIPTKVKKLRGTYQPCRAAKNEFTPPAVVPSRPAWLDDEARLEWDRVVPQLADHRLLSDVDRAALADYCTAHSVAVKAAMEVNKKGLVIKSPFGPKENPAIRIAEKARAQALRIAIEFGLTPSSRSRISTPAPKEKEEDKTEDFLFGRPRLVKPESTG